MQLPFWTIVVLLCICILDGKCRTSRSRRKNDDYTKKITWVSIKKGKFQGPVRGSVEGNTEIFLRLNVKAKLLPNNLGFCFYKMPEDGDEAEDRFCTELEYLTVATKEISIRTVPHVDLVPASGVGKYRLGLQVGMAFTRCTSSDSRCMFQYSQAATPEMVYLTPVAYAGQMIDLWIVPYYTKTGSPYFDELDIGGGPCDLTPYFGSNSRLSPTSLARLRCDLESESNKNAKPVIKMSSGVAQIRGTMEMNDESENEFLIRILPAVRRIYPRGGSTGGGLVVTITGDGFSEEKADNKVFIQGRECPIKTYDRTKLTCTMPPTLGMDPDAVGRKVGLERLVYRTTNTGGITNFASGWFQRYIVLSTNIYTAGKSSNTEVIRGYYVAPETGTYWLRISSYLTCVVYFGNSTSDKAKVIDYGWKGVHVDDFYTQPEQKSPPLSLTKGQPYYVEMQHRVYNGQAFLGIEQEHTGTHHRNMRQVQKVSFDYRGRYEIHYFIVEPPTSNYEDFYYWKVKLNTASGAPRRSWTVSRPIYMRASATAFYDAMKPALSGLWFGVTVMMYDMYGNLLEDTSIHSEEITTLIYKATIYSEHWTTEIPFLTMDEPPELLLTEESYLDEYSFYHLSDYTFDKGLYGTYGINFQHPELGNTTIGPFDICEGEQSMIRKINWNYPKLKGHFRIWRYNDLGCRYTSHIYFRMDGFRDMEKIIIQTGGDFTLIGGHQELGYLATVDIEQPFSENLFQPFITYEQTYVEEHKELIEVYVKDLPGACTHFDCKFKYMDFPGITDLSYNFDGERLTVTFTGTELDEENLEILSIKIGDTDCDWTHADNTRTATSMTCIVEKDDLKTGGSFTPQIFRAEGALPVLTEKQVIIDALISGVFPVTWDGDGGEVITITGTGFPTNMEIADMEFSALFGGLPGTIISTNNTEMRILTPVLDENGPDPGCVSVENKNKNGNTPKKCGAEIKHDELKAEITGVTPNYVHPYLKEDLIIDIKKLPKDSTAGNTIVFIEEDIFQMLPIREISEHKIVVMFGGYKEGVFHIVVKSHGYNGYWKGRMELTVGSSITSITPNIGSWMGGTKVVISGQGFYPDYSRSNVYVYMGNTKCDIHSASHTKIECVTQSTLMHESTSLPDENGIKIAVMMTKASFRSKCEDPSGICEFTMSKDKTPIVNSVKIENVAGEYKIRVTGSNFAIAGDFADIHLGLDRIDQTIEAVTDTEILAAVSHVPYTMVALATLSIEPYGYCQYQAIPSTQGEGEDEIESNQDELPPYVVLIPFDLVSIKPALGSKYGTALRIRGGGFSKKTTSDQFGFELNGENLCDHVEYISFTEVICHTVQKEFARGAIRGVFEYFIPVFCDGCEYETSADFNGLVTNLELEQPSTGHLSATIDINSNSICDSMEVSLGEETKAIAGGSQVTWDIGDFPIGKYKLKAVCRNGSEEHIIGYSNQISILDILITYHSKTVDTSCTYGGGYEGYPFEIRGPDLGKYVWMEGEEPSWDVKTKGEIFLTLCHHVDVPLTKVDNNTVKFVPPKLLSEKAYERGLRDPVILEGKPFGHGGSHFERAFDGNEDSYFSSNHNGCYVGTEQDNVVVLRSAKIMIPNMASWKKAVCGQWYVEKAQTVWLEASVDGTTYTKVGEITPLLLHGGWVPFELNTSGGDITGKFFRARFERTCIVAELELIGEDIYNNDDNYVYCDLTLNYMSVSGTMNSEITLPNDREDMQNSGMQLYMGDYTAIVQSINETFIEAELGKKLHLSGVRFRNETDEKTGKYFIRIRLSGIECTVYQITGYTDLDCEIQSIQGVVAGADNIEYMDIWFGKGIVLEDVKVTVAHRWTNPLTWGGFPAPVDGDSVHVPVGQTLLFDLDPVKGTMDYIPDYFFFPRLNLMVVEGTFIVKDHHTEIKDRYLGVQRLIVREGHFIVGTEAAPLEQGSFTLYMNGDRRDRRLPIFGTKAFGVYDGEIQMHGKSTPTTWSNIDANALKGDAQVTLPLGTDLTNWNEGDWIVFAPSEELDQTENVQIKSIEGVTIMLETPLQFDHRIHTYDAGDSTYSFPTQVGLLSHNIKIRGDFVSTHSLFGGVLKVYGQDSLVKISGVEFYKMGQNYEYGQYAVSLVNLDCATCYIKHSSLHSCMNRALTLDNVYQVTVENNVAANILGDGFALDNVRYVGEVENTFKHNFVTGVRKTFGFLEKGMVTGSGFLLPSPTNHILENVVAGAEGHGFYFRTTNYYENQLWPLGTFKDNYVHTIKGIGFYYLFMIPREKPITGSTGALKNMFNLHKFRDRLEKRAIIDGFKAFRTQHGIYIYAVGALDLTNTVISDTRDTGVYIVQADEIERLKIEGMALIRGGEEGKGLGTPMMADAIYNDIKFVGYDTQYAIIACRACGGRHAGYYWGSFSNISWVDSPKRVHWNRPDLWIDVDGTFSDHAESTIAPNLPHINIPEKCVLLNESYNRAMVCNNEVRIRTFMTDWFNPGNLYHRTFTIRRIEGLYPIDLPSFLGESSKFSNFVRVYYGHPAEWGGHMFKIPVVTNEEYWFDWKVSYEKLNFRVYPWHRWDNDEDGDIILHTKYKEKRKTFAFYNRDHTSCSGWGGYNVLMPKAKRSHLYQTPMGNYYHNVAKRQFSFIVGKQDPTLDYIWHTSTLIPPPPPPPRPKPKPKPPSSGGGGGSSGGGSAPVVVVPPPPPPKPRIYDWTDCSHWPNSACPVAGSNVTIPKGKHVNMNLPECIVDTLTIKGILSWELYNEDSELHMTARRIIILGGQLLIGNITHPFENKARITITDSLPEGTLRRILAYYYMTAINVHGTLIIHGKEFVEKRLATLEQGVSESDTTLNVESELEWEGGDELLIGASGYAGESQEAKVISYGAGFDGSDVKLKEGVERAYLKGTHVVNTGRHNVIVEGGRMIFGDKVFSGSSYGCIFFMNNVLIRDMGTPTFPAIHMYRFGRIPRQQGLCQFKNNALISLKGPGIIINSGKKLKVTGNIIYRPKKVGINVINMKETTVSGNIIMSVEDPEWKNWTLPVYAHLGAGYIIGESSQVTFTNNMLLGSENIGIVTSGDLCSKAVSSLKNNTIQSTTWAGWYVLGRRRSNCVKIQNFTFLHNMNYAILAHHGISTLQLKSGVFDSNVEIIGILDGPINTTFKVLIMSVEIIGNHAEGYLLNTAKVPELPALTGYSFENVINKGRYNVDKHYKMTDNTVTFINMTISEFKEDSPTPVKAALYLPDRSLEEQLFFSPYVNFKGVKITNVDKKLFMKWETPYQHLVAFEGAVTPEDWEMVQDFQVINNMPKIADLLDNCTLNEDWNAYYCENIWLGMLTVSTHHKLTKEIYVTRPDGYSSADTIRYKMVPEGADDLRRVSKLVSIVTTYPMNNIYNIDFMGTAPQVMTYNLFGQPASNGVHLIIKYINPYSVRVKANGKAIKSQFYSSVESTHEKPEVSYCGENVWSVKENTLDVLISGGECSVLTYVVDAIRLSLRIKMTRNKFYQSGGPLNFIDRMALLLNIRPYRIRVVGVRAGSLIVESNIEADPEETDSAAAQASLVTLSNTLVKKIQDGEAPFEVLSFQITKQFTPLDDADAEGKADEGIEYILGNSEGGSDSNTKVYIIIIVGGTVLLATGILFYCLCKRKDKGKGKKSGNKIMDITKPDSPSMEVLPEEKKRTFFSREMGRTREFLERGSTIDPKSSAWGEEESGMSPDMRNLGGGFESPVDTQKKRIKVGKVTVIGLPSRGVEGLPQPITHPEVDSLHLEE